jgi:dihydrodipicolinate reductase
MATGQEQWEYCRFEDVLGGGFVAAKLVFFTAEGEKIETLHAAQDNSQRSMVAVRIAQLGNEGWEMAGTGITGQGAHAVYFKRKKS